MLKHKQIIAKISKIPVSTLANATTHGSNVLTAMIGRPSGGMPTENDINFMLIECLCYLAKQ